MRLSAITIPLPPDVSTFHLHYAQRGLSDSNYATATMFADGNLTDVLRNMSNDPMVEQKVKKKLNRILASWHAQYKNDPSMRTAANLYKQHKSDAWRPDTQIPKEDELEAAKRKSKEEARRKAKEEAEKLKREEKKKKREGAGKAKPKRKPFNFEEVPRSLLNAIL